MDGARKEFFARAGFAEQEDGRFRRGDALSLGHGAFDRVRLADDARETVAARPLFAQ